MNLDVSNLPPSVIHSLRSMISWVEDRQAAPPLQSATELATLEAQLREEVRALGRGVLRAEMERADISVPGISIGEQRFRRTGTTSAGVETTLGSVQVETTTYRARGGRGGKTIRAVESVLGIIDGMTSSAAKLCCFLAAHMTYDTTREALVHFGAPLISTSTLGRLMARVGSTFDHHGEQLYERIRVAEIEKLPPTDAVAALVVGLDGVMVPMRGVRKVSPDGETTTQGYKEASAATIQLIAQDGEVLHTIRWARMPEYRKSMLAEQMQGELGALRLRYPSAVLQALADGAHENWRILSEVSTNLGVKFEIQNVDYYHAKQHMFAALAALGAKSEAERWGTTLVNEYRGAEAFLQRIVEGLSTVKTDSAREALTKEVTYFNNNVDRMAYRATRERGLPIASGTQESACKTLVTMRLKGAGMSWGLVGGQAILTARSLMQSKRWDIAWRKLDEIMHQPITREEKALRQRPRLAA